MLFSKGELAAAAQLVYQQMHPTQQIIWPQLCNRINATVWVKHENHTPTGAFKFRGGVTYIDWLKRTQPEVKGIVTATRGNHGQSQARAATASGLSAKVYVPHGNSVEKNTAMKSFGADVIEFGADFDTAKEEAIRVADAEGLHPVFPFHKELVRGVATYGLELMSSVPDLDTIYVAIGCGSGICGLISARDALGVKTHIVGVVSTEAMTAKLSFEQGTLIPTDTANTFADGVAVRVPVAGAFEIYSKGAERIVAVSDDEVAEAMRIYFSDTHNVAEGGGAVPLAALIQDKDKMSGKQVAVILSGGNVDSDMFATVLQGNTPNLVT